MKRLIILNLLFALLSINISAQFIKHEDEIKHDSEIENKVNSLIRESETIITKEHRDEIYKYFYKQKHTINVKNRMRGRVYDPCFNGGFELGTFESFEAYNSLYVSSSSHCDLDVTYSESSLPSQDHFEIVSQGFDPYANINMVHSGNYAARINSDNGESADCEGTYPNYGIDRITKTFEVEEGSSFYNFWYAIVFESPHEHEDKEPFFNVKATRTSDGEVIDEFCVVSIPDDQFFQVGKNRCPGAVTILYKDWSCHRLDLQRAIGEEVVVSFTATDCGRGAHFGYAYIDDLCLGCEESETGDIELDPIDECIQLPTRVCGTFTVPVLGDLIGTLESVSLSVKQDGVVVDEFDLPDVDIDHENGIFCFELLSDYFPAESGGYDILVTGHFVLGTQLIDVVSSDANQGVNNDISFDCCDELLLESSCTTCSCGDPAYVIAIQGGGTVSEMLAKYTFTWTINGDVFNGGPQRVTLYYEGFAYQIDVVGIVGTEAEGCDYVFTGLMYCDGDCPEVEIQNCSTVTNPDLLSYCEDGDLYTFMVDNNQNLVDPEEYYISWEENGPSENPHFYWPGSCGPHEVTWCLSHIEYSLDDCGVVAPLIECNSNTYDGVTPDIIWPMVCGASHYEVEVIEIACNNVVYNYTVDTPLGEEIYGQVYYGFSFDLCDAYYFKVRAVCSNGQLGEYSATAIVGSTFCFIIDSNAMGSLESSSRSIRAGLGENEILISPSIINSGEFAVDASLDERLDINVYSMSGELVKSEVLSKGVKHLGISTDGFQSGIYIVTFVRNGSLVTTKKIEIVN